MNTMARDLVLETPGGRRAEQSDRSAPLVSPSLRRFRSPVSSVYRSRTSYNVPIIERFTRVDGAHVVALRRGRGLEGIDTEQPEVVHMRDEMRKLVVWVSAL